MYQLVIIMENGLVVQPYSTLTAAESAFNMTRQKLKSRYVALFSAGHMIREDRFPEMGRPYKDGTKG